MLPLILSIREAAKLLGITERAVRMRIFRKQIPHRRWGRRVFILPNDLEQLFQLLDGVSIEEALQHIESGT